MKTTTAGVLGTVTLLAGAGAAQAAPTIHADLASVMNPTSYAELLQPIPDATSLLQASDAQASQLPLAQDGDAALTDVQFHHHHHHHHHFHGPFFHHHHHGFYRRFYHHHHHHHFYHHHHHHYY